MGFELTKIPSVDTISKDDFIRDYFIPQKPLKIRNLTKDWAAKEKWSFDYLRDKAGEVIVPIYDGAPISASRKVNEPVDRIPLKEYLDIIEKGPTKYRIFFFNIFKSVPELQSDFKFPDLGLHLSKKLPVLFFGGAGSAVFLHYDIDLADILHFNFAGKKECILFGPEQSKYLYKVPFSVVNRDDIDIDNPDFTKFPALKNVKGHVTQLEHGECLYMPSKYWHYMKYLTGSFSMTLRAFPRKPSKLAEAAKNVFVTRHFDNAMRQLRGEKWMDWKKEMARKKTEANL